MTTESFADWMGSIQSRTETALDCLLPGADIPPQRLHQAMRYAMLGGGKRMRPLLCHAAGAMFSAPLAALDAVACAVELIHGYSLVHDDLPCVDNDMLRRGKPSCHVEFGEATALLAGDALQSLAFRALSDVDRPILRPLADAVGSLGMAGGQELDLDATGHALTLAQLESMHNLKTGALIRAAVLLGAMCGDAGEHDIETLSSFSAAIGLLFQIVDDILDAEASTESLGKTAGKDASQHKPTYVSLLGAEQAREKAAGLRAKAHTTLDSFGARALRLRELTDYIVDRNC